MINLKPFKFAFVFDGEDLINGKLEAAFKNEKEIANHIKSSKGFKITLKAFNSNNEEYEICIFLKMDKEDLDKLQDKFISVADKVNYIDFYEPNSNKIPTIGLNTVDDMYANPGNIWVKKDDENTYFFKISIPEEKLFIWFYLEKKMISYE